MPGWCIVIQLLTRVIFSDASKMRQKLSPILYFTLMMCDLLSLSLRCIGHNTPGFHTSNRLITQPKTQDREHSALNNKCVKSDNLSDFGSFGRTNLKAMHRPWLIILCKLVFVDSFMESSLTYARLAPFCIF